MPPSACSRCPVRDLGKVYPVKDPNDPWRRMPRLMEQLVATFGKVMYNRKGRTRIDTEARITHYCERVRSTYGDDCSADRMRLCCGVLHGVAQRASRSSIPYPIYRAGLSSMLDSDVLHTELKATRAGTPINLDLVLREIDHVV